MVAPETVEYVYRARGGAARLFKCNAPEVLIEGPAGTGKTRAWCEKLNWLAEDYPGCRILIARQTRVSLTESVLVTLETKVFWQGHHAMSGTAGRANRHSYDYPNGSSIVLGGLENPDRLFSTEWDVVVVPEATEASEDSWEKFARAMRNKGIPMGVSGGPQRPGEAQAVDERQRPRYWTQRIADCNPGPPGHWLNQRALRGGMVRILSRHEDNPSITEDFLVGLRALTGHRRARLYEGRWVAGEGTVYPEFSEDRHVVQPFPIPHDWPHYVGWDAGYDHPTAILWFAVAPNGTLYVVDELYRGGLSVADHCKAVHDRNAGRTVMAYYADPQHCFSQTAQAPKTIAQQAKECGISMTPWPRTGGNEESMVNAVRERLTADRLKVFAPCANTIREFQSWSYKRTAAGELPAGEDKFEDRDNHAMDVCKGVVATHPKYDRGTIRVVGGE